MYKEVLRLNLDCCGLIQRQISNNKVAEAFVQVRNVGPGFGTEDLGRSVQHSSACTIVGREGHETLETGALIPPGDIARR